MYPAMGKRQDLRPVRRLGQSVTTIYEGGRRFIIVGKSERYITIRPDGGGKTKQMLPSSLRKYSGPLGPRRNRGDKGEKKAG